VGFAAGNNIGIRTARQEFAEGEAKGELLIATLNTDTRVDSDYLEQLSNPMRDEKVGACAPLMLEMERPEIVDAAGIRVDAFGYAWNVGAGEPAADRLHEGEAFGACAGAALYRDAMLKQIGLFDDAYFGFYEDADLALRARRAGWKTRYVPGARVYHQHGASFGKIAPYKTYLLARNRWWTMFKNPPRRAWWLVLPAIAALDAGALLQAARRGHLREAWQGRADAWRTRKEMLAKRQDGTHSA
jgi:GT2 family glycosyltransferase